MLSRLEKIKRLERENAQMRWLIERLAATLEHASMRLVDAKQAGYPALIEESRALLAKIEGGK